MKKETRCSRAELAVQNERIEAGRKPTQLISSVMKRLTDHVFEKSMRQDGTLTHGVSTRFGSRIRWMNAA